MLCKTCGAQIDDGCNICNYCGAEQTQPPQPYADYQQPYTQPVNFDMTREEFFKQYMSKKSYSSINTFSIICFISAALAAVSAVAFMNIFAILDIVLFLVCGILLRSKKQLVYAVIPAAYGAFGTILSLTMGGAPTGIVALILGVQCVMNLSKAEKAYKNFCENHVVPTTEL